MGTCFSTLSPEQKAQMKWEQARSRDIEQRTKSARQQDASVKKLLLLGAGESGKSTLFKQMITLYGKGYSREDLESYRAVVFNNCLTSMKTLLEVNRDLSDDWLDDNPDLPDDEDPYWIDVDEEYINMVEDARVDSVIDERLGTAIKYLWEDEGVQNTYEERSSYQLMDSASYFFNRIDEIMQPGYCPTQQDVLCSRVRTTGIVETSFEIESNLFKIFDVGGQRNERKKWIHCFENVTCVLFVAAISEYDQVLYEDESTNRMVEALELFEEIVNSRWFRKTSVILFLNKRDLFAEKIKRVPLTVCDAFSDYDGSPNDYDQGCAYLTKVFHSLNHTDNELYTHITCATDSGQIFVVFNAVKDIIIRLSLKQGGLMM